jgi:hypothetical protein
MSDKERFLTRWSRRKRGGASDADEPRKAPEKLPTGTASETAAAASTPGEAELPVDLASLPPVDTIGAESDIRGFLAPGVPTDLSRAALRRAWLADPRIRDFIGLSENSWDFNAPGGVPGFGSLSGEDVRRLLAQATGEGNPTETKTPPELPKNQGSAMVSPAVPTDAASRDQPKDDVGPAADAGEPAHRAGPHDIAMQHELDKDECCPPLPKRRHGGALPE